MRIAVNTRLLLADRLEGIGRFTNETLKILVAKHPEVEWIFFFDRAYDEQFVFGPNVTPVVVGPQARHPVLWTIWFEHRIPKLLKKYKADLFLSPDGYNSLKADVLTVCVMHDLNFEHNPDDVPGWAGRFLRNHFPKYARKASRVATVSEFSKKDIVNLYQVPDDRVDVVYNGVDQRFSPLHDDAKAAVKSKHTDGADYFVYIGSINPRKNITRMLQAYDLFRSENESDHKLVLVGAKMNWTDEMESTFTHMEFKNDVIFLGRLPDNEMGEVLGAASAMLYVSYFEGFGIPIIEAFQAGVPVITSNVTSMPEVAGDAALLVDPRSAKEIANAMAEIIKPEVSQRLTTSGTARAQEFTWERTAGLLWECLITTGTNE